MIRSEFKVGKYAVTAENGETCFNELGDVAMGFSFDHALKGDFLSSNIMLSRILPKELASLLQNSSSLLYLAAHGDCCNGHWYFEDKANELFKVAEKIETEIEKGVDGVILRICNPGRIKLKKYPIPIIYPHTLTSKAELEETMQISLPEQHGENPDLAIKVVTDYLDALRAFETSLRPGQPAILKQNTDRLYEKWKELARKILSE